jgi:hypothetical protein
MTEPSKETGGRSKPANGPDASRFGRLQRQGRQVQQEARALASGLEEAADEIEGFLREQMEQRPYGTLATAAGVGYVLGGGIPSPLTRLLLDYATRFAFTVAVMQVRRSRS